MRSNLTVHVPQNQNVSYSLFAKGLSIRTPQYSEDESELIFTFQGGTAVVLFYFFGGNEAGLHCYRVGEYKRR